MQYTRVNCLAQQGETSLSFCRFHRQLLFFLANPCESSIATRVFVTASYLVVGIHPKTLVYPCIRTPPPLPPPAVSPPPRILFAPCFLFRFAHQGSEGSSGQIGGGVRIPGGRERSSTTVSSSSDDSMSAFAHLSGARKDLGHFYGD